MKRSPIVAVGTVVGLASVLSFHSSPAKISLSSATGVTTTLPTTTTSKPAKSQTTTSAPATTTTTHNSTGTGTAPTTVAPTTTTTVAPTTTTVPTSGVRSATGPLVNYYFGVLSVKVTANGKKITAVTLGSISDGGNPRSQQIDQYATPILAQEAMAAQSSNIQSISGARYTSAGFQMSLQYALKKLGI